MFTWIPIYEEAATRLLEFQDRQQELIQILSEMTDRGLKATSMQDKRADGSRTVLTELDPFTFLGNFNRSVTAANRSAMWTSLKEAWRLASQVPEDYDGVPVLNPQKAWLLPYQAERNTAHVPTLWSMFEHILNADARSLDATLFDRCISFKYTACANLTMGMYWARPKIWLATDSRNLTYASSKQIALVPKDGSSYKRWISLVREKTGLGPWEFSSKAYLSASSEYGAPFDSLFPDSSSTEAILDALRECVIILQDGKDQRDARLAVTTRRYAKRSLEIRIIYGNWLVMGWRITGADGFMRLLLPTDSPHAANGENTFSFVEEIHDRSFGIYEFDAGYYFDNEDLRSAHLDALRRMKQHLFQDWQRSNVAKHHLDTVLRLIMDRDSRPDLLAAGLTAKEIDFNDDQDGNSGTTIVRDPPPTPPAVYTREDALRDIFIKASELDRVMTLWRRKRNLILQGAPGTGKTFFARRLAFLLMGRKRFDAMQMVQFHQSSSYEDFIQGIRPDGTGFSIRPGVFQEFCRRAMSQPEQTHVFIIDEINRGNLSKVFGELLMLIEPDKRGPEFGMRLTYSNDHSELFYVPDNVYLIGTMNTADRSLSLVDYALRRRFGFWEMQPGFNSEGFAGTLASRGASARLIGTIRTQMNALNQLISEDRSNLGSGYRIGHSFFVPSDDIVPDESWLLDIIEHEILPLVEEYWVDDQKKLDAARRLLEPAL